MPLLSFLIILSPGALEKCIAQALCTQKKESLQRQQMCPGPLASLWCDDMLLSCQ